MDHDRQSAGMLALRGIAGLFFGLLALAWPGAAVATFLLLFAVYALIDSLTTATFAITARSHADVGFSFLRAAVGFVAGVVTFFFPDVTAFGLALAVGAWAVSAGAAELVES